MFEKSWSIRSQMVQTLKKNDILKKDVVFKLCCK